VRRIVLAFVAVSAAAACAQAALQGWIPDLVEAARRPDPWFVTVVRDAVRVAAREELAERIE
jgi:hypothetical protein